MEEIKLENIQEVPIIKKQIPGINVPQLDYDTSIGGDKP